MLITFCWSSSILIRSYTLLVIDWDEHVHSEAFDRACDAQCKRLSSGSSSSESSRLKLWDDDSSSQTSVESSHVVSKIEAHLYYHGLRGDRERAPKLVYRTSEDVFTPPSGPAQELRTMELLDVDYYEKLSKNNLWRIVLGEVRELLEPVEIGELIFVPRSLNSSTVNRSSLAQSTSSASAG